MKKIIEKKQMLIRAMRRSVRRFGHQEKQPSLLKEKPQQSNGVRKVCQDGQIHSVKKDADSLTVSGIARLFAKAGARVRKVSVEDGVILAELECAGCVTQITLPVRIAREVALSEISGSTENLVEEISNDIWQIKEIGCDRPISLIPLNAALWNLAGVGEEVVAEVRQSDFNIGNKPERLHFERAQLAKSFGILDDITRLDYATAVASQFRPEKMAVMAWVRHEWKLYGTTTQVSDEIKRLVSRKVDFKPEQLMFFAAFFYDAGEYMYSLKLMKMAKEKLPKIWETVRYPALTRLLVREGVISYKWAQAEAELVDYITQQEDEFPRFIRDNRESFAIVGNGPRQIGLGTGNVIDEKNIVIRLNSGKVNANFSADYGWKQNVWVKNHPNYDVKRNDKIPGLQHVIISGSSPLYRTPNSGAYLQEMVEKYGRVTFLPEEFLRQTIASTNRNPSSGIVMLTWLNFLVGELKDQKNVFGFSLNDQKSKQTNHYYRKTSNSSRHTHNWDIEKDYFDKIVKPL